MAANWLKMRQKHRHASNWTFGDWQTNIVINCYFLLFALCWLYLSRSVMVSLKLLTDFYLNHLDCSIFNITQFAITSLMRSLQYWNESKTCCCFISFPLWLKLRCEFLLNQSVCFVLVKIETVLWRSDLFRLLDWIRAGGRILVLKSGLVYATSASHALSLQRACRLITCG